MSGRICRKLVSEPQCGEDPLFLNALVLQKPRNLISLYGRGENFQKEGKSGELKREEKYAYFNGRLKRVHKLYNDRDEWPYTSIGSETRSRFSPKEYQWLV